MHCRGLLAWRTLLFADTEDEGTHRRKSKQHGPDPLNYHSQLQTNVDWFGEKVSQFL
jgi:hypothetical protein